MILWLERGKPERNISRLPNSIAIKVDPQEEKSLQRPERDITCMCLGHTIISLQIYTCIHPNKKNGIS